MKYPFFSTVLAIRKQKLGLNICKIIPLTIRTLVYAELILQKQQVLIFLGNCTPTIVRPHFQIKQQYSRKKSGLFTPSPCHSTFPCLPDTNPC